MGLTSQRAVMAKVILREEIYPMIEAEVAPVAQTAAQIAADLAATAATLATAAETARLRGMACLLRSGTEPMDGDLDMGGHRITNEQHGGGPS